MAQIGRRGSFTFLSTLYGGTPGSDGVPYGPEARICSFSTVTDGSVLKSWKACWSAFSGTFRILRQSQVQSVMVVGAAYAVPMLLAARLRGRKAVFVESITRVDKLSVTGLIVYHSRLASLFVIQWPDLQQRYRRSRLGSIL